MCKFGDPHRSRNDPVLVVPIFAIWQIVSERPLLEDFNSSSTFDIRHGLCYQMLREAEVRSKKDTETAILWTRSLDCATARSAN